MRMIDELEARGQLPAAVIVKLLYSGPMHVIDDHPIGPITITEPTRVQGWVRGSVTVPQGQSLSVSLATENYTEINRAYYTAEPADYFQERLDNLLITAGAPESQS